MSSFYDVVYTLYGQRCSTTMLADSKEQIIKILGENAVLISYKKL